MNWIIAALLMFLSSNIWYLLIRKYQKENDSHDLLALAMMFFPVFFYFPVIIIYKLNFLISFFSFAAVIFSAFLFSYLGNKLSLLSLSKSLNPGYSLIISKSYVIFTTLVAVFIFNSTISFKNILAIILSFSFRQ